MLSILWVSGLKNLFFCKWTLIYCLLYLWLLMILALLTWYRLAHIQEMLFLNAVLYFVFIFKFNWGIFFASSLLGWKNLFCLIFTKMNTQFVINKLVTKVFKAVIPQKIFLKSKNLFSIFTRDILSERYYLNYFIVLPENLMIYFVKCFL